MVVEMMLAPLQFGVPGGMELAVILLIAVLLFGANKIPKLARSTGQAMGEFQRGRTEIEQELESMKNPPEPSNTETTTRTESSPSDDDEDESSPVETSASDTDEAK